MSEEHAEYPAPISKHNRQLERMSELRNLARDGSLQLEIDDQRGRQTPPGSSVEAFKRNGLVQFSLGFHSSVRQVNVDTLGLVDTHTVREVGDENVTLSYCDVCEQVDFADLKSLWTEYEHPADANKKMTYATGDSRLASQAQACVLRGGKISTSSGNVNTQTSASIRVVCSNAVTFDSSKGYEHFLFLFGPAGVFKPTFFPSAKKTVGSARLEIFDLTNGERYLGGFAVAPVENTVRYADIENQVRRLYPDEVFDGRRIGFRLTVSSSDISPGPDEAKMCLLGSNAGFSVLPMKAKTS